VKLVIFHYHFLTGGVTTVIRQALPAIRRYLPEVDRVQLVGGRSAEGLFAELTKETVSVRSFPPIDYREPAGAGSRQVAKEARGLAAALLERFGGPDVVWWVHNHHLGKNTVFTQALLEVLSSGAGQRMILQIHDFPEAGRSANLRLLNRSLTLPPYPVGPHVRYAVLTPRDRTILLEAGMPQGAVFLLGNPVPPVARLPAAGSPVGPAEVRRKLADAFSSEFPAYDPALPLAVYPVRTIRRKNVLEAGLLASLSEQGFALAVTLPGLSRPERAYSDRVEAAFRTGLCRGLWGIGGRLESAGISFDQLVGAADLIISPAVQEGYGYLFINALQWQRPLVARDLDILEGTRDLYTGYPACFYRSVSCPLERGDRSRLRRRYLRKLRELSGTIPREVKTELAAEIEKTFCSELVEFSYLPVDRQEAVLARLADPGFSGDVRRANRELAEGIPRLLSHPVPDLRGKIDERFGLRRYAEAFGRLLNSFATPWDTGSPVDAARIQEQVVRRFARLEYLRLLYD
jgi:hypothetical protein